MTIKTDDRGQIDEELGCSFIEVVGVSSFEKVKLCKVKVEDLCKISSHLASLVQDSSWVVNLDSRAQRAYQGTAKETADKLVEIFNSTNNQGEGVGKELGELIVSMGSAKALSEIFSHHMVPLAELWKPQKSQNEGFDFHTVCVNQYVNFGEAKFKSKGSAYTDAMTQARGFVEEEKHFRDAVHLEKLVSNEAMRNLDGDNFGVVFAFSLNAADTLKVMNNAFEKLAEVFDIENISAFYLVGVEH